MCAAFLFSLSSQLCNEEFVEKWSDASEGWMYLSCLRVVPEMTAEARGAVSKVEAAKPSAADAEQQLGGAQAAAHATKEEERLLTLYRAQQVVQHMEMYQGRLLHSKCHFGVLSNIAQSKRPTSRAPSPAVPAAPPTTTAPAASAPAVTTAAAPSPSPQPAQSAPLGPSATTDSSATTVKTEEVVEQPPQPSPPQEQPQPQPQEESPTPPQPEPIVVKAEAAAPVPMDESKDATITTTTDSSSASVVDKPSNNNAEEDDEEDEDDEPPAFVITADGV
jgi:hypothetical protein